MAGYKPGGSPDLMAFLVVKDPRATMAFAAAVLDAKPVSPPLERSDGSVWNVEMTAGDSRFYISGAQGDFEVPGFLYAFVPDCDATYQKALDNGANPVMPPEDRFYGARDGGVSDANGTLWWFATQKEDVDPETLKARAMEEEKRRSGAA